MPGAVWQFCSRSPCPCSRPLLTCTSAGDTQAQFWLSLCGVPGSWWAQVLFEPSECLWQVRGLSLNSISPPYHLAGASALPLDVGYLFLVGSNFLQSTVIQQRVVVLEFSKKMSTCPSALPSYFCFIDYDKAFDCVDHNKLENSSPDGNTNPPYLPPEKSVWRSRSNR